MNISFLDVDNVPVYSDKVRLQAINTFQNDEKLKLKLPSNLSFFRQADMQAHFLEFLSIYKNVDDVLKTYTLSTLPLNVFRCLKKWFLETALIDEAEQLLYIEEDFETHLGFAIAKENQDKVPATKALKTKYREEMQQMGWQGWASKNHIKPLV